MSEIPTLMENNRRWAEGVTERDPEFFERLSQGQSPQVLWIGCADSRVPANQVIGLDPGEVFVHRNIANVVVHSDFNCLSVIEYAVAVLKVRHVIVCGHYGCGGVMAASHNHPVGLIDNWLRHIRDVRQMNETALNAIEDDDARFDRLCELNVIEQVHNVCRTTIVQQAWEQGQDLSVHGLIYNLKDGLLRDLETVLSGLEDLPATYRVGQKADPH
ncbi:MAG: carbonate dehydratase [Planctomycetaceae bacterium]|nr:carbonate dehydratase [Planctomycetaceae bacterium]|tara:strand:- start:1948 stop:2595 length:648 start_codon:yes stop_codon:yes gene_type:complete